MEVGHHRIDRSIDIHQSESIENENILKRIKVLFIRYCMTISIRLYSGQVFLNTG